MEQILFSEYHMWISADGENTVKLGISDYAQKKLGAIMFINLPEQGDVLTKGETFGDVESIKNVSDLISPITGEVLEVNETVIDTPEKVNSDPYTSWLLRVKISADNTGLLNASEYIAYLEQL